MNDFKQKNTVNHFHKVQFEKNETKMEIKYEFDVDARIQTSAVVTKEQILNHLTILK